MNVNFFTLALGVGDVAALATVSAYAREDLPKALDVSFSIFRLLALCVSVRCFNDGSRFRLVTAFIILCAALPAYLGYNEFQDDAHLKLDFIISTCFAVSEALLLAMSYQLASRQTRVDSSPDEIREALLEEGRARESSEHVDPFKGQGPSFRRLLSLSYPERYILAVATLALFVSTASSVVTPALFGRLIQTISVVNEHTVEDREKELNRVTLLLILMFIVTSIFSLIRGALYTLAGERLVARFRVRLFDAIIHQDIEFFDRNQSGELQSRLSSDTASIQNAVTVNVSMALRWTIQAIVSMVIIFVISWKLTLVMLAVVPAVALGARLYGTFVRDLSKRYQDALAKAAETAEEALGNVRTVRSFCKENFEVERYKVKVDDSYEQGKRRAWAYGIFVGAIGMLAYLAVALVLWRGGMMVIHGTDNLSSADLTSFLLYTLNLAVCLGGLSELYSTLVSAMGASERLFKILDTDPVINNRARELSPKMVIKKRAVQGASVTFSNVDFAYPTRQDVKVLKNISLTCEAGTVNAFCGASGQGKSTIISLIQRFYDPTAGRILVSGVDIQTISPVDLRSRMSIVSQEPTLFASTIAQNIGYGINRVATQEEIVEAAKKANAYDFISGFPSGFETLVGERGVQLSGGQRQRIAIARAILADPDILLLDEATSALDSQSEHLVQLALNELMKGRTTIIVAHRLSTVRHANCIFVIDQGTVAEKGTYEDLIASGGIFSALVSRQLSNAGNN